MTLTGVTEHKIHTIRKIRATIPLRNRNIRHTIYVVKDDFPIDYDGILGIDFLQQPTCDLGKKRLRIGNKTLRLQSYIKSIKKPRSETIIQAIISSNRVGIVKAEETMPGIFIENCLIKPDKGTCSISIINITDEQVVIPTSLVTIEELSEDVTPDTAKKLVQVTQRKGKEPMQACKERLKNSLCTDLNEEEKETFEQICEEFCDTFYLEDDVLTCTSTVSHKILRVLIAHR